MAADRMIYRGEVVPRRFALLSAVDPGTPVPPGAAIPCADWLRLRAGGAALDGVGLRLEGDCDLRALRPYIHAAPLVALHIPRFSDGRCYTHARRLRHHWGYRGTLLAHGDVLRDQLPYLARVGFDAFYLRDDQDPVAALAALSHFTAFYQYPPARTP